MVPVTYPHTGNSATNLGREENRSGQLVPYKEDYTDEAGHHQKWERAGRLHEIPPLSTNCPSMQTREPPTAAGNAMEAADGEARG